MFLKRLSRHTRAWWIRDVHSTLQCSDMNQELGNKVDETRDSINGLRQGHSVSLDLMNHWERLLPSRVGCVFSVSQSTWFTELA